jgi:hypothetical protein
MRLDICVFLGITAVGGGSMVIDESRDLERTRE